MVNTVLALLFSFVGVSSFSPARVSRVSNSLKMSYENEIGALPPTGFWDPLGLANGIDQATFDKRREAELKHGRVAMLAVTGYIFQAWTRFPGTIDLDGTSFQSIPNGIAALSAVPAFGWFQIAASVGYWEIFGWKQTPGENIGDFGYTLRDWKFTGEKKKALATKEIQNGRLAMIAIAELLTHDLAKPGSDLFDLNFF